MKRQRKPQSTQLTRDNLDKASGGNLVGRWFDPTGGSPDPAGDDGGSGGGGGRDGDPIRPRRRY